MANPTTNFGWVMPTSASLVTNLPADFNTFGQAVDTSMSQLKGGTTGQILSKTSATDMAFTWITNDVGDITAVTAGTGISGGGTSGAVTITNSMATEIAAKGDLIVGTGSAAFDNLTVGANNTVLTADSSTATGLKWAAAAGGGKVLQVVTATTNTSVTTTSTSAVDSGLSASITPSSASSKVLVIISQWLEKSSGNAGNAAILSFFRGATEVGAGGQGAYFYSNSDSRMRSAVPMLILDSPSTTSSTTYKTKIASNVSGQAAIAQVDSYTSSIVLMEIGA